MKKAKIIVSILFLISTALSLGFSTYFFVTYFRRNENKQFEAAYIYNTSYETSVDVDLGLLIPGESKDMSIPVVSLMNSEVIVEMSIRGEENSFNDYVNVSFEDTKEWKPVSQYINENIKYKFTLAKEESRNVHIYYSLNKEDVKGETNIVVFIKARNVAPLEVETEL